MKSRLNDLNPLLAERPDHGLYMSPYRSVHSSLETQQSENDLTLKANHDIATASLMNSIRLTNTLRKNRYSINEDVKHKLFPQLSMPTKAQHDISDQSKSEIIKSALLNNARKSLISNSFTADKRIKFVSDVIELVEKVEKDPVTVKKVGLEELSDFVQTPILAELPGENVRPARYELHKKICDAAYKLMSVCKIWPDEAIQNLNLATYLNDDVYCDADHKESIGILADFLLQNCKEARLVKILRDVSQQVETLRKRTVHDTEVLEEHDKMINETAS